MKMGLFLGKHHNGIHMNYTIGQVAKINHLSISQLCTMKIKNCSPISKELKKGTEFLTKMHLNFWKLFCVNNKFRRTCMHQDQKAKASLDSIMKPEFAGTNAQKVKEEIQKDVSEGQGAMTAREAGAMQD